MRDRSRATESRGEPRSFTNTFHEFDMKPGGAWHYTMHGPDGKNYENEMKFVEITEARIVIDHVTPPRFRLNVLLEELGDRTKITFRQFFETSVVYDGVKRFAVQGNEYNLERLTNHVAKKQVV